MAFAQNATRMTDNEKWSLLRDIPDDHRLPFAVFHSRQCGMDDYEGAAFWSPVFDKVAWFTECAKQRRICQ